MRWFDIAALTVLLFVMLALSCFITIAALTQAFEGWM